MPVSSSFRPATDHLGLGDAFFDPVQAADFPRLVLRHRDDRWAARVGLDTLSDGEWLDHFGRFQPLPGSLPEPLALRYHGHQFGSYNPELGDGRGFLFAQMRDRLDGRLLDCGTKGSGQTPWSRFGDGRLTLNGGLREVLATSQLEALGVNTSKSLSLVETGEALQRNDEPSPTRAAVLVRLSHGHIRIGSFQRLLYLEDHASIERLLDYAVATYLPEAAREATADRAVAFLEAVGTRVARTGAQWMAAGFVHGVLNTDNINITGESFDYGPWRFLPTYDAGFTAAYFDHAGRYAYGQQPSVLLWNLTRLAECLLPLAPQPTLEAALARFAPVFRRAYAEETARRLGLAPAGDERDEALLERFWQFVHTSGAPFEQVVFDCFGGGCRLGPGLRSPVSKLYNDESFTPVRDAMAALPPAPDRKLDHPYFADAEPCTMLFPEVDGLLQGMNATDDWAPFRAKLAAVARMADAYGTTPAAPPP